MDLYHYEKMNQFAFKALEYAEYNGCEPVIIGAAPDLCDIPIARLLACKSCTFVDIDPLPLKSISNVLSEYGMRNQYCNNDITGVMAKAKKDITQLYLHGLSPSNTIKLVGDYFNSFSFDCVGIRKKQVLLSLNVISELQPPLRAFIEKIHRFYFGDSIENTIEKSLLCYFKDSNKAMYNKFVKAHLTLSDNFFRSYYMVSAYENERSYIDSFMVNPTDDLISHLICKLVKKTIQCDFWNWHISPSRVIRMCQFVVER